MKKIIPTLILVICIVTVKAQFVYSTVWSDYSPTYTLTSGFNTTTTPGFMWCGYQPQLTPGNYPWSPNNLNIFVRGFGASSMWTSYKLYEGNPGACAGPLNQIMNGNGVSMTEVAYKVAIGPVRYTMAGAYDNGAYFIAIGSGGNVIDTKMYPYPSGYPANAPAPTKPVLIQDYFSTDFYIAGSVGGQAYVMRVDINGNQVWSVFMPLAGIATPKDLAVTPKPNGELLIAGVLENGPIDSEGFLARLDCSTGQVNGVTTMGNPNAKDGFNTIVLSYANVNGGFPNILLGGFAETSNNNLESWLVKLSLNGNVFWSQYLMPSSGTNYGIVDMLERRNIYSNFEIYPLIHSASGMLVLKLDDLGQPFPLNTTPANSANEFLYNLPGSTNSLPAAISMINGLTNSPDIGLQVYGTANNIASASTSHMVQTYFNGETNCNRTLMAQNNPINAPFAQNPMVTISTNGLSSCGNFTATAYYPGGAINFPCSGYLVSGSNARNIATNVAEQHIDQVDFKLQPNPTNDKTTIVFSAQERETVSISVSDLLGRQILSKTFVSNTSGELSEEISFSELQASNGVYYLNLTVAGKSQQQKIVLAQ